jgi:hypothetical protein
MKITVITGARGKIIGAFHGHASELSAVGRLSARPVPGLGQKFQEIDVPEDVFPETISLADAAQLPQRLKPHLSRPPQRRAQRAKAKKRSRGR